MSHSPHTRTRLLWRDGKRVRAHRWIMEQVLGRSLLPGEHVHHKDGDPLNNDLSNLEVMDTSAHMQVHKAKSCEARACINCGEHFAPIGHHRHRQKCCCAECAQAIRVKAALRARGCA